MISVHNMKTRIHFQSVAVDRVTMILKGVAREYGLTINDLRGESKCRHIAHPRQIAYIRLRDETNLSYPAIGRIMGNRDHTTILKGEQAARARLKAEGKI